MFALTEEREGKKDAQGGKAERRREERSRKGREEKRTQDKQVRQAQRCRFD